MIIPPDKRELYTYGPISRIFGFVELECGQENVDAILDMIVNAFSNPLLKGQRYAADSSIVEEFFGEFLEGLEEEIEHSKHLRIEKATERAKDLFTIANEEFERIVPKQNASLFTRLRGIFERKRDKQIQEPVPIIASLAEIPFQHPEVKRICYLRVLGLGERDKIKLFIYGECRKKILEEVWKDFVKKLKRYCHITNAKALVAARTALSFKDWYSVL